MTPLSNIVVTGGHTISAFEEGSRIYDKQN